MAHRKVQEGEHGDEGEQGDELRLGGDGGPDAGQQPVVPGLGVAVGGDLQRVEAPVVDVLEQVVGAGRVAGQRRQDDGLALVHVAHAQAQQDLEAEEREEKYHMLYECFIGTEK